jgi:Ca2+-binding EF-hand superfamily protein
MHGISTLKGRTLTDEYLREMIEEVDLSRDGLISYEEFLNLWDVHGGREMKKTMSSKSLSI